MRRYLAQWAWLGTTADEARPDVLVEIGADGRFGAVTPEVTDPPADAIRLVGLTIPGLANAHSHAFHRALRGRTHAGKGTFWTWRNRMYELADRLDPDSYLSLARATYAEMALAGITCVGEFHYLHHAPDGRPYDDPNAMGNALLTAAAEAGIRITLLDTIYLTSTVDGAPPHGPQRRFSDGSLDGWRTRHGAIAGTETARIASAVHSVRAVPAELLDEVADGLVHIHLSEQRAENQACRARYGCTPTELLDRHGLLGPGTTAVHATHLTDLDRTTLGDSGTGVCFCPTTERDLADGIGLARALVDSGSPLSLGTDSHAVIDMFEEARAVELDERLRSEQRGHFAAAELLRAATAGGHAALGWTDAGQIAPGQRADLVTVRLDSVRTTGTSPGPSVVFTGAAADVTHVVRDGSTIVRDGVHCGVPDVARALDDAIRVVIS